MLAADTFVLGMRARCVAVSQMRLDQGFDVWATSLATLGNIGADVPFTVVNTTSVHLAGGQVSNEVSVLGTVTLSRSIAAMIVMGCNLAGALLFLWFVLRLRKEVGAFVDRYRATKLTPASFAIRVRGLPHTATWDEVAQHFSGLYDLGQQDWRPHGGLW